MSNDAVESEVEIPRLPQAAGRLFLDKEGRWFHEGVEITHERTLRLFSRSLVRQPDGSYSLQIGDESAPVDVEDTAFVVRSISARMDKQGKPAEYVLVLSDGGEEPLDPSTLEVDEDNVMYCRVKNGVEKARLLRPAYYQLCSFLECDEAGQTCWLPWQGSKVILCGREQVAGTGHEI